MKHLTKSLRVFAATLVTAAVIAGGANAAVIVTDLGAGVNILNSSQNLDLNNDASTDYILSHGSSFNLMRLANVNSSAWVQDPVSGSNYPDQLAVGNIVGPSLTFVMSSGWNFGERFSNGAWINSVTGEGGGGIGYLGFRFSISGETHFGWAELDYSEDGVNGGTLLSYAYESQPNTAIAIIPEPSSIVLLGMAALGFAACHRRTYSSNKRMESNG